MRILIAEDEKDLNHILVQKLTQDGYSVDNCYDGQEAMDILTYTKYDAVILDIMMPKADGFAVLSFIRQRNDDTPVLFLTAKDSLKDRMQGLTSGAEDYMVKPFEVVELLARVNIVLRRYHKMEQKITFMDIELDSENQVVTKTGKEVELTPKEFELLEILMRNRNITLFREKIYEEIWGTEYSVESRTLDLHIQRLRKKLNLGAELKTVFKAGYRLEDKA